MTVEEFLALPHDDVSRELIRGQLRERGPTYHTPIHGKTEATLAWLLGNWLHNQPEPRGAILSGEAGFLLRGTRDSLVGIDVAYVSADHVAAISDDALFFEGAPVVAVEIIERSETQADIVEKLELYKEAGATVWIVDPEIQTVSLYRPGSVPETFNTRQELVTEPELPGFRVAVARIFEV